MARREDVGIKPCYFKEFLQCQRVTHEEPQIILFPRPCLRSYPRSGSGPGPLVEWPLCLQAHDKMIWSLWATAAAAKFRVAMLEPPVAPSEVAVPCTDG